MLPKPSRSEIWRVNLDPPRGHEQAGVRPALIISVDAFNHGPAELVTVLPITTRDRKIPLHTSIKPPEGGVKQRSFVLCDQTRTISRERLVSKLGSVTNSTMAKIEDNLRILLSL